MSLEVLGISTSPRVKGNSDLLLREVLAGAESAGARAEYVRLADLNIGPCLECNACYETGVCRVQDDYQQILEKLLNVDRLIFATPVFFMSVCAQAKALIDRGQCLWARKYVLKQQLFETERDRRAMVIAVGGSKSKEQFESIRLTMKSYFDSLQISYVANLFVSKIDVQGAIEKHPSVMKEAFRRGKQLVSDETPVPNKPVTVELF